MEGTRGCLLLLARLYVPGSNVNPNNSVGLQGGCIIRAAFLNDIKAAYKRKEDLKNLLVDPFFAKKLVECEQDWRKVVCLAITNGVAAPGMTASLSYFDTYRRDRLPANLVQVRHKVLVLSRADVLGR